MLSVKTPPAKGCPTIQNIFNKPGQGFNKSDKLGSANPECINAGWSDATMFKPRHALNNKTTHKQAKNIKARRKRSAVVTFLLSMVLGKCQGMSRHRTPTAPFLMKSLTISQMSCICFPRNWISGTVSVIFCSVQFAISLCWGAALEQSIYGFC